MHVAIVYIPIVHVAIVYVPIVHVAIVPAVVASVPRSAPPPPPRGVALARSPTIVARPAERTIVASGGMRGLGVFHARSVELAGG